MNPILKTTLQFSLSLAVAGLFALGMFLGLSSQAVPVVYAAGETCFATINGSTVYSSTNASAVRDAVAAAIDGETVKVAGTCAGVDTATTYSGEYAVVNINKNITVQGGYTSTNWTIPDPDTTPTTLDAQRGGRVIYINNRTVTIENTSLISGATTSGGNDGGGLYIAGGSVAVISNTTIYSNTSARLGGGLYVDNSDVTLLNSAILSNTATAQGGAVAQRNGGTTVFNNTQISYNQGSYGGALNRDNGLFQFINSTISYNRATESGGALQLYTNGRAEFIDSTVISNTATIGTGYGGGLLVNDSSSSMALTNTVVSYNQAGNRGGGIETNGPITLHDGQITSNVANSSNGGGLYLGHSSALVTQTGVLTLAYNQAASNGGGLYVGYGRISLNQARLLYNSAGNQGGAVYQYSLADGVTITNSCIVYNSDTAVYRYGGPTLTAAGNWWGAANGPGGDAPGNGDSINDAANIDTSGFLTSAPAGCPAYTLALTINGGNGQTTPINQDFAQPLQVTLTTSENGLPYAGEVITFTGPVNGAGINPAVVTDTTNASGVVSATVTANGFGGSYSVTATAAGVNSPATFTLTNTGSSIYLPIVVKNN